jgi:hypothetical protein
MGVGEAVFFALVRPAALPLKLPRTLGITFRQQRRFTLIGMRATLDPIHLARPHRPVLVAGTLGELTGPTHGLVELPLRLWWGPQGAFDLGEPTMLTWMYENVLREAIRVDELRAYVNGAVLPEVWPDLNLPRAVRAAWEARHPRLRLAAARRAADQLAGAASATR